MARTGRRESLRLLEAAFGAGIAYFDVARSYGYGEAERAVGEFAGGRREQVTIATKLGIEPPPRSRKTIVARAAARRLLRVVPRARGAVRRRAEGMTRSGSFGLEAARRSLETSLRELRTDYVDVLLLHECDPEDVTPELLGFLRERVDAGQVRRFGIATGAEATRAILATHSGTPFVVQVPFSALEPGAPPLQPTGGGLVVHSVLGDLGRLGDGLVSSGEVERWSEELEVDLRDRAALGRLMLGAALASNPQGTTLFSSRRCEQIRANADLASGGGLPPERLRVFWEMVRQVAGGDRGSRVSSH